VTSVDPRDQPALDALRRDRDECGPGLTLSELAHLGTTWHPLGVIRRLNRAGYQLGEAGGLYQLGHEEPPASSGDETANSSPTSAAYTSDPPADVVAPRLFDPCALYALEAA
jgi:hypothetical protein